jgi:hypothetical protein
VLQTIAMVMKLESHNGHWLKDANTAENVRRAVTFIIGQFAERYQSPSLSLFTSSAPIKERAESPTPESLAHTALQTVRRRPTAIPNIGWMLPGSDGETK